MGNQVAKAKEGLLGGRKKKDQTDLEEFSQEDIQKKFKNIPKLSIEEKKVLRSSWKVIAKKIEKVSRVKTHVRTVHTTRPKVRVWL